LANFLSATYKSMHVVVKTIRPSLIAQYSTEFAREAQVVSTVGIHPNVVTLIGYHLEGFPGEGPIICLGM
jgi:hypothetical protein